MTQPGPHFASALERAHRRLQAEIPSTSLPPAVDKPAPVRLALNRKEAAAALGISVAHFERHVQAQIRCVRLGRRALYPVKELDRWIDANLGARRS